MRLRVRAGLMVSLGVLVGSAGLVATAHGQAPIARIDSSYGCVRCHAANRRAFISGVHAERGIRCADCHGGDPASFQLPQAHRPPFVGTPSKLGIAQMCAACHSDPDQMRQFGLPADQLAGLRTSRHGQLLERGDSAAATCTDCHEAHLIRRSTDARSNTHPLNIAGTCIACHNNAALMSRYGLETNQFEEYRASAHGVALYDQENLAAPSCNGCHGSHEALPPGTTESADVCGQCHDLVRRAFYRGPHGAASMAGRLAGCLGCHANHATTQASAAPLGDGCRACHAEASQAAALGIEIERHVLEADTNMEAAEEAIRELVRAGRDVTDLRHRLRAARTQYLQVAQVQHSLDIAALEDLGLRVRSTTQDIVDAAEVMREHRWEHKLLLIPVWFLAVAVIVTAAFRLAESRKHEAGGS